MPLVDRLRNESQAHHACVESLPCFRALANRTLPPGSQRALHQALALLHEALTQALAATSHPALMALGAEAPPVHPLLDAGLVSSAPQDRLESPVVIGAIALGERMRSAAHREPLSLLGYHYALRLALLPLPGTSPWSDFAQWLEGRALDAAEEEGVLRTVGESFTLVRNLLDALHPPREHPPAWWLNRDAGSHPITTDLDELRAALRAAEASWEEFPYYAWRYGEHGRQFSWSDSAWLVTLGGQGEAQVWKHISWLGGLLANRGMPRLMLERHLRVLSRELVHAKPMHRRAYDVLSRVAERMAGERRRILGDDELRMFGEDFDARVGPEWSQRLRGAGELLAAAVADEYGGIAQAVPSLASWMREPSRFPAPWIRAVERTLLQARSLCRARFPSGVAGRE
ncbi:hypothetical protein BO221_17230 [Archangium sp. Cb G35]|uniref:hypothetical protein n=1 Tax=Archangium sp. Cb G35 TaxID=1920190 RepID=UPI000935CDFB|nr:hypothetical protein [Archangium sp. Cb G35]OJT23724.1 hypothetical protein BO221_17230 [Archangium sp. Cb G35]